MFLGQRRRATWMNGRTLFAAAAITSVLYIALYTAVFTSKPKMSARKTVAALSTRRLDSVLNFRDSVHAETYTNFNGTFWYRLSKPWRGYALETVSFAFRAKKADHAVILAFAQRLDGVFTATKCSHFAILLDANGALLLKLRPATDMAKHSTFTVPGEYNDGQWHSIAVKAVKDKLSVAVTSSREGGKRITFTSEHDLQDATYIRINSGMYFGGVIDTKSLTTNDLSLRDSALFHGSISNQVHLNGLGLDLKNAYRGLTEDRAGPYLLEDIKFDLSLPLSPHSRPNNINTDNYPASKFFPVVSAISEDHAKEIEDMIGSARHRMPLRGVLVYDLGLNSATIEYLEKFCKVAVRKFRRDLYGGQMWNLKFYMWKPIIVQTVVQEFGGAIYSDSSIRFQSPLLDLHAFTHGYGVVGFEPENAGPLGAFTHDGMLDFFGVRREEVAETHLAVGTCQAYLDTPFVRQVVLRQWFRCALDLKCMAPEGSTGWPCDKAPQRSGRFVGCHRYDQSAISLALYKAFKGEAGNKADYIVKHPQDLKFIEISRFVTNDYPRCRRRAQTSRIDDGNECHCEGNTPGPKVGHDNA